MYTFFVNSFRVWRLIKDNNDMLLQYCLTTVGGSYVYV